MVTAKLFLIAESLYWNAIFECPCFLSRDNEDLTVGNRYIWNSVNIL